MGSARRTARRAVVVDVLATGARCDSNNHAAERERACEWHGSARCVCARRGLSPAPRVILVHAERDEAAARGEAHAENASADEPCAGRDPIARLDYLSFMESNAANPKAPTILFVTHHVEEITPSFTHALLLREGRVTAAGPMEEALTSDKLSEAFQQPVRLRRREGRYLLEEA